MTRGINLVGTRVIGSRDADLQRWYSDHVLLLLRAPELQGATLYRRVGGDDAPHYLCLYEFADMADFQQFEQSDAMADARRLSQAAYGRDSVEIVERMQFQRWLTRDWAREQHNASSLFQAQRLRLGAVPLDLLLRWLNDRLQNLASRLPLLKARLYGAPTHGMHWEIFVLLEVQGTQPLPVDWWSAQESDDTALPEPKSLRADATEPGSTWLASYQRWGDWRP